MLDALTISRIYYSLKRLIRLFVEILDVFYSSHFTVSIRSNSIIKSTCTSTSILNSLILPQLSTFFRHPFQIPTTSSKRLSSLQWDFHENIPSKQQIPSENQHSENSCSTLFLCFVSSFSKLLSGFQLNISHGHLNKHWTSCFEIVLLFINQIERTEYFFLFSKKCCIHARPSTLSYRSAYQQKLNVISARAFQKNKKKQCWEHKNETMCDSISWEKCIRVNCTPAIWFELK